MMEHYRENLEIKKERRCIDIQEIIITQKVKADDCIAQEIVWLNSVGVYTEGCCCGHGLSFPNAVIKPSSKNRAIELGYEPYFDDDWIIQLKSKCQCDREKVW
jgi:hypothetical protein